MSERLTNQASILKFPFHKMEVVNTGVTITKNKAILNKKFLVTLIVLGLACYCFFAVIRNSPHAFKKSISINGWLFLFGVATFIVVTLYFSFRRMKRVVSNFLVTRRDQSFFINESCLSAAGELPLVIIQNVGAISGVGGSFTVGVANGKKFYGLCYDLDEVDARKAANFLMINLGLEIHEREAAFFPLIQGH